jgi:hypothetical protein
MYNGLKETLGNSTLRQYSSTIQTEHRVNKEIYLEHVLKTSKRKTKIFKIFKKAKNCIKLGSIGVFLT